MGICAVLLSFWGTTLLPVPEQSVTLTALNEKNEASKEKTIYLDGFTQDGEKIGVPEPVEGRWEQYKGRYVWFAGDDERRGDGTTESVTFELEPALRTEVRFLGNQWKGLVKLESGGETFFIDTYSAEEDETDVVVRVPRPPAVQILQAALFPTLGFAAVLLVLCAFFTVLLLVLGKPAGVLFDKLAGYGVFAKLLRYQFLFEELVKRDFKKKYKRTVLGMLWSVLSPLLMLLVMRLVFTQFFGRETPHYTTYLFCGNLVFSYFNESTTQGMSALRGNAGIFTKVNVPKYLFLLSKNVQTLINFGLTMCVFIVFCVIDHITFTWKFVFLLYPIAMLLLFNIGVGLILSALFIFFQDIQYLWSVFIQLLMYVSAIFYTIDSYSHIIQCMFLLNPVYLFIRYFRKIVVEATIPTVYFHLLMLADVLIVLGIGSWMYKKYNTKFLYYV